MRILRSIALTTAVMTGSPAAFSLEIQLPVAESPLKPGVDSDLVTAYCSMCHSLDYITTQPPHMPRRELAQRRRFSSSPLLVPKSDAAVTAIVDYLVKTYGAP